MHFGIFQNINNYFKTKRFVPPKKSAKGKAKNQSTKIIREFEEDEFDFKIKI